MYKQIFHVPIFVDKLELTNIKFKNYNKKKYERVWITGTPYTRDLELEDFSEEYLYSIFDKNFKEFNNILELEKKRRIIYSKLEINRIWKNYYKFEDYQESHIHGGDFSFIINESLKETKTVFLHPCWKLIQCAYSEYIGIDTKWHPKLKPNEILIFPGLLEHYVVKGGLGITISGNFILK